MAASGAIAATPCPAGSYQPSTGQTACLDAPAGSFVAASGAIAANPCPAGSYTPTQGQTSCLPAGIGYYVAGTGQSGETACPAGTTTSGTGATSAAACLSSATALSYTGLVQFAVGTTFTPTATLSSATTACQSGQPVTFSLSTNPVTGATTSYQLGSTVISSSAGAVTGTALSTATWKNGVYLLTVSYAGTSSCTATSTSASVTVTVPGEVAFGGGSYTPSLGPTSFGFFVLPGHSNGTYAGQLNLVTPGKWWFQANVTGYVKAGSQGQLAGTGSLSWWNATLNHGHGGWVLAKSGVAYKAIANASTKTTPASFGINIAYIYTPAAGEPTSLPNSSPLRLTRGGITIS